MPQRKYSKERRKVARKNKRIVLPIELEEYNKHKKEPTEFRIWLDEIIETYPELFPAEIASGYWLHDVLPYSQPQVQLRRIRLIERDEAGKVQVFTIAPSAVLLYVVGLTDEVEKPLFLRRFGVPYWGLSYVFGRKDDYWYRLDTSFGRYEIVSTTLKASDKLPQHLLADEKHVRFNGEKVLKDNYTYPTATITSFRYCP